MDGGQITIGDNVFIGPNCGFYTATHPLNFHHRNEGFEKPDPFILAVILGLAVMLPCYQG